MSEQKLTPWFPGHIKPTRHGVYQNGGPTVYQHWNGKAWGYASHTPEGAAAQAGMESIFQNDRWRGLAEDPKGKA
jgi:hypothetical protein